MTPVTLNRIALAPYFADGNAAHLIDQARQYFEKRNLRGYGRIIAEMRSLGFRECQRLNEAAANKLKAAASDDDRRKAAVYAGLTGKARKRFGWRHSDALTRAGARCGSSLPRVGAKQVWGINS